MERNKFSDFLIGDLACVCFCGAVKRGEEPHRTDYCAFSSVLGYDFCGAVTRGGEPHRTGPFYIGL